MDQAGTGLPVPALLDAPALYFLNSPFIFGRDDVEYIKCSDEHGVIADPVRCPQGQRQVEARAGSL